MWSSGLTERGGKLDQAKRLFLASPFCSSFWRRQRLQILGSRILIKRGWYYIITTFDLTSIFQKPRRFRFSRQSRLCKFWRKPLSFFLVLDVSRHLRGGEVILQCSSAPGLPTWPTRRSTTTTQWSAAGSVSAKSPSEELCGMTGTLGRRGFQTFLQMRRSLPTPLRRLGCLSLLLHQRAGAEHLDMRVRELCELHRWDRKPICICHFASLLFLITHVQPKLELYIVRIIIIL